MNRPHRQRYSLLVLAGGASSRMGQPKALLTGIQPQSGAPPLPLLERWFRLGEAAEVDVVCAVLGVHAPEIVAALPARQAQCLINPDPQRGMSSSLLLGLQALRPLRLPCLVTPVDCPPEPIDAFLQVFQALKKQAAEHPYSALLPSHQGRSGHPVLLSEALVSALSAQVSLEPLDRILNRTPGVHSVEVPFPQILVNLNTPGELLLWQLKHSRSESCEPAPGSDSCFQRPKTEA